MKKRVEKLFCIVSVFAYCAIAAANPIETLREGEWFELSKTKIRGVLPSPLPRGDPATIVTAWSGGAVDTKRDRLIVWGGGHNDYYGNELYALDLNTRVIQRLTDPSPIGSKDRCSPTLADGTPASRHTYGGLTYIAHVDRLFVYGGCPACPAGYFSRDTWTFDLKTLRWHAMKPSGPTPRGDPGVVAAYDPVTKKVFLSDTRDFYSYSFETNSYTRLATGQPVDYHLNAAIDPKRRQFLMLGNGHAKVIDLKTNAMSDLVTTGDKTILEHGSPGLAYDPVADRFVAWHGRNLVYVLDPDKRSWTSLKAPAGPPEDANDQGTFGRWGYVPHYGVFALIYDIDKNGYVFRLRAKSRD